MPIRRIRPPLRETPWQSQAINAWIRMGATVVVLGHPRRRVRCPECGADATDYRTQQTRGTWDLLLLWPQTGVHQAVEMKTRTGTVRAEQSALHAVAARTGLPTFTVRSPDDVVRVARAAGVRVRRTA
ncbi:MAG TPA: hypothetical protein VF406_13990 [Thermodesulfobacteriota bacterium]